MRTVRNIALLCTALIALPMSSNAAAEETSGEKILRCDELAHFSATMVINRDKGGTLARAKELLEEDTNFSEDEKKSMYRLIVQSYAHGALSPAYIKKHVVTTCYLARR
jgi:hypothetical protein